MTYGISTKISDLEAALRIAADLTALAIEYGAVTSPSITTYSFGVHITLSFKGTENHTDIAAWQLATGGIWDVETIRFMLDGKPCKTRTVRIPIGGTWINFAVRVESAAVAS